MITVQQTYFMSLELLIQACCTVIISLLPQNWRLYRHVYRTVAFITPVGDSQLMFVRQALRRMPVCYLTVCRWQLFSARKEPRM